MEPSAGEENRSRPRSSEIKVQLLLDIHHPLLVAQIDVDEGQGKCHIYKLHNIEESKLKFGLT